MTNALQQILQNQILIMEELRRTTSYPTIEENIEKAIAKSNDLIYSRRS